MIFSQEILARSATDFADFLIPHPSSDDQMLDVGCGAGTITMGLAEHVSSIVGIEDDFKAARDYLKQTGQSNIRFQTGDLYDLDFPESHFDACLCHSVLEVLEHPKDALTEIKRTMKPNGIIGVASVEYGGIILAGENTGSLKCFYALREKLWQLDGLANPYFGRNLRGLVVTVFLLLIKLIAVLIGRVSERMLTQYFRSVEALFADHKLPDDWHKHIEKMAHPKQGLRPLKLGQEQANVFLLKKITKLRTFIETCRFVEGDEARDLLVTKIDTVIKRWEDSELSEVLAYYKVDIERERSKKDQTLAIQEVKL